MTSALDQKGLTTASETYFAESFKKTPTEAMAAAIRAYLSTVTPAEIAEVVEKLSDAICENYEKDGDGYYDTPLTYLLREAAALIERLAAEQAETRRLALEEAAKVVEARGPATQDMTSTFICAALDDAAAAIRALIDQPSTEGGKE
ncbi:hypothetical protein [Parvibaculum sp.]|uniref:hypothetical protein n=1 Tax=Parvibaculum sp. TaxID=2024848 RepID=UPI003C72A0ED